MSEEIISIQVMNDKGELKSTVVVNREKAIELMAKARCSSICSIICDTCKYKKQEDCIDNLKVFEYWKDAELSLNGLLKGE